MAHVQQQTSDIIATDVFTGAFTCFWKSSCARAGEDGSGGISAESEPQNSLGVVGYSGTRSAP